MATQTIIPITRAGLSGHDLIGTTLVAADVGGTDKWLNTGKEFVYVNNGNGSSLVVTLQYNGPSGSVDGQSLTNKTVTIATGKSDVIGPFPTAFYNDSNGFCTLGWSVTSSVKLAVLQLTDTQ